MRLHLTRSARIKVGWLIALAYLFCVLAPGAALAVGVVPSCLSDELHLVPATGHMQADGPLRDHGGMETHDHADAATVPPHHSHDSANSQGPCCTMTCATALAADLPMMVKPSQPVSICTSEVYRETRGDAPPLLYRPPIS